MGPTPKISARHLRETADKLKTDPALTGLASLYLLVFAELLENGLDAAHQYWFDRVEPLP